ncbi:hypothetical protein VNO77_36116 [Canavalia gladiata]|uniref:Uncharacterized protein n=1 Tax=Canavalia gladiata TaxID=3824 RepID=A0AAN9PU56_CANGL
MYQRDLSYFPISFVPLRNNTARGTPFENTNICKLLGFPSSIHSILFVPELEPVLAGQLLFFAAIPFSHSYLYSLSSIPFASSNILGFSDSTSNTSSQ